ncbi:hypothetical protein HKBW3S03_01742, partial [Candidatus Hakubella thermalkaliphila]
RSCGEAIVTRRRLKYDVERVPPPNDTLGKESKI